MPNGTSSGTKFVWIGIAAIVLIISAFALFYLYIEKQVGKTPSQQPEAIIDAVRAGQYQEAVRTGKTIQASDSAPEAKALAVFNALGAEYQVTGDISARIADVDKLKAIAVDPKVKLSTRVNAINLLAEQYSNSGLEPAVAKEIFTGAPFSSYLATSTDLDRTTRDSTKNLYLWSYSLMPTSFAAINVARWNSEQPATQRLGRKATTTRAYMSTAEEWLRKADTAAAAEKKRDTRFESSARYFIYREWRAIIIGRLAVFIGEPFTEQFMGEYADVYALAQKDNNVLSERLIPFVDMYYAGVLRATGHTTEATATLDKLAGELNAIKNPDTDLVATFLRNEYRLRPNGPSWQNLVAAGFPLSSSYKQAVMKLVATTTPAR